MTDNNEELEEIDTFKTISPVTVYISEENNKTKYYNPGNKKFLELLKKNLETKHLQFYNQPPENFDIQILKNKGKTIDKYKDTIIEAHDIVFSLDGNRKIKELAYNIGIGAKNSQGFGCIERGI